jgi:hypothetical protein
VRVFTAHEFLEIDAAFALEADIDERHAVFDGGDGALDDAAFEAAFIGSAELLVEHGGEIVTGGIGCSCHKVGYSYRSFCYRPPVFPGSFPPAAHHCGPYGARGPYSPPGRMPGEGPARIQRSTRTGARLSENGEESKLLRGERQPTRICST